MSRKVPGHLTVTRFLIFAAPVLAQNSYVDSRLCAVCHADIARTYRDTGMARSFYKPNFVTTEKPFFHSSTHAYYSMLERDGKLYQRRWQIGAKGENIYAQEWLVDYVMGSGNHVRTYLHRSANGTLIELPLAWYSEKGGYFAMNPGYDTDHFITPRKIAYECMFCHNAYPPIPPGHERENSVPVYTGAVPEGIDCQRCHGPGANHILTARTSGASRDQIRQSIFNPARLSGDRQMEVCMQCHLQTTSEPLPAAIRQFDRGPFSYRAGEPLSNFMLFFERVSDPKPQPKQRFEIVSSVVRLRQSRCFIESKGALTCLTCHDPHNIPRGEAAAEHYNAACRNCHATGTHVAQSSNCTNCHMPKRRTDDVVHAVMTDHLIQRNAPPNLLAEIPETHEPAYHGAVIPYYPKTIDALYLAVAQVKHQSNLNQGIVQLRNLINRRKPARAEFYFELGEAYRGQGDAPKAVAAYEQSFQRDFRAPWTSRRLADALFAAHQQLRALGDVNRAIALAPDDARGWYALGEMDAEMHRFPGATAAFKKSATLDPDQPDAFNGLGSALAESGSFDEAEKAFQDALTMKPDLASAQVNLAMLLASKGRLAEAVDHFERSLAASADIKTRSNFAIVLAKLGRSEEAKRQVQLAIQEDPNLPEPRDILGNLLANEGRFGDAIRELREALRVHPDYGPALVDLGIALAQSGDVNAAVESLQRATNSSDPQVKQRALAVLNQIRR